MKIEIWNEPEEAPERRVRLKLQYDAINDGSVDLVAVDERGVMLGGGVLLTIYKEGIDRIEGMSSEIGFELDSNERIKIFN